MGARVDMMPVTEVVAHIEKLRGVGMSISMIARAAGVSDGLLSLMVRGKQSTTRRSYAEAVLSVDGRPMKHQALVLGVGTRRRLQGLAVTGWTLEQLAERLGTTKSRVRKLRESETVTWAVHQRVKALFESLGDGGNRLARMHAERQGWRHPFDWLDIDDPFAEPLEAAVKSDAPDPVVVERLVAGVKVPALQAEKRAALEKLLRRGWTVNAAAEFLGMNYSTAQKYSAQLKVAA